MAPCRVVDFSPEHLLRTLTGLPRPSSTYWVAYSGGLDSSVLLYALAELRNELSAPLRALHLDHGLQAGSDTWVEHCARVCDRIQVPLTQRRLWFSPQKGKSLEAIAREARLSAFRKCIGAGDLLLTAQHADDQAETLLLQLLRGSGLDGLAAMPMLSDLPPGHMARPLLGHTRAQLKAYALRYALDWVDDPSNRDDGFDRNYLRLKVMPLLGERWPAHAHTLSRSARHCAEAGSLIHELTRERMRDIRGRWPGTMSVEALKALDAPLSRTMLRQWIAKRGFRPPGRVHLERIRTEVLTAAADRSPMVVWSGAEVRRYRNDLFLLAPLPELPRGDILWPGSTRRLDLPRGLGYLDRQGRLPWPDLVVRFRVPGAGCRRGPDAPRKTLKKLYQEIAVADWLRPYVPLLYAAGELVAVADLCDCGLVGALPARWRGHSFADCLPQSLRPVG